jgi:SPX domain protein involved in polyphosphate accumulation
MPETDPLIRYELKMTYALTWLSEVQSWIMGHPAAFVTAYPPRWVNSLYFDTPDLDSYNDHLAGVPERRKLRFRWYGETLRLARGQMEIKNKSERASWKVTQSIDQEFDLENLDWGQIMDGLRQLSKGIIQELLSIVRPTVINVYWREYYVSSDGLIRLTLDSNLQAYDQWFTSQPNLWFRQPLDETLVLELKGDVAYASMLADILAHFPSRVERRSKYVDALGKVLGF